MKRIFTRLLRSEMVAIALLGCMLYPFPPVGVSLLQGLLASIFVLYLPGYRISHILFVDGELSVFERFVMSIAISLAVIVFVSLYMYYFGLIISLINVFLVSIIIICLSALIVLLVRSQRRFT